LLTSPACRPAYARAHASNIPVLSLNLIALSILLHCSVLLACHHVKELNITCGE